MYHTIEFTNAQWGYLHGLVNLGRDQSESYGRGHHLKVGTGGWGLPGLGASKYGRSRPWGGPARRPRIDWKDGRPTRDAEAELQAYWKEKGEFGGTDYYVTLSEGERNGQSLLSTSVEASPFYPERVFVWGYDEEGDPLDRSVILEHLRKLGNIRDSPAFWEPCLPWRGYDKGLPTFHEAIRANTDTGVRWHDVRQTLEGKLPEGYSWDQTYGVSAHGILHFDGEES